MVTRFPWSGQSAVATFRRPAPGARPLPVWRWS